MNQSDTHLDRRLEYLGAWSGIAWLVLAAAAFGGSGLIPVLSPSVDAEVVGAFVLEHRYQILVGMTVLLLGGFTFLVTWSLTFAYQIRKYANRSGLAFYLLMVVGLLGGVIAMLIGTIGAAMAFRAETIDPGTAQLIYDLMWFLFLIPWPPFMLWQFVSGFAILSRDNDGRYFPRWTGYFSLWAGALEVFSALSVFFHQGPFSYNGAATFWLPGASFFIWVGVLSVVQIRSWHRNNGASATANESRDGAPPAVLATGRI